MTAPGTKPPSPWKTPQHRTRTGQERDHPELSVRGGLPPRSKLTGRAKKAPGGPPEGGRRGLSVRASYPPRSKMPGRAKNRPRRPPGGGGRGPSIPPGPEGPQKPRQGLYLMRRRGRFAPKRALQGRRPERPAQGQTARRRGQTSAAAAAQPPSSGGSQQTFYHTSGGPTFCWRHGEQGKTARAKPRHAPRRSPGTARSKPAAHRARGRRARNRSEAPHAAEAASLLPNLGFEYWPGVGEPPAKRGPPMVERGTIRRAPFCMAAERGRPHEAPRLTFPPLSTVLGEAQNEPLRLGGGWERGVKGGKRRGAEWGRQSDR